VVAGQLARNPDVDVLLLEAGGSDDVPGVLIADQWATNLGSDREWGFNSHPGQHVNNRSVPLPMCKVLGGGSSINGMIWARGHKADWDFFASTAGDERWSYSSALESYRRIEDWHGQPDPHYRGTGGSVYVEPAREPSAIAVATLDGARSVGIPMFENMNGRMMEGPGGTVVADLVMQDGQRRSVFRSYVYPLMDRPNLTVLTGALVTRVVISGRRATAVEFSLDGASHTAEAREEIVLSLGAINTPKVLMQSGIGNNSELRGSAFPSFNTFLGSARIIKTIRGSTASGNTSSQLQRRTTPLKWCAFGRVIRVRAHQTYRSRSSELRCIVRRSQRDIQCRSMAGH
jgi:choline dehydrogenase